MKNLIYFTLLLLGLVFTNCKKDSNDNTIASEVAGTYEGDYTPFNIQYKANAVVTATGDDLVEIQISSPDNSFKSYSFDNLNVSKTIGIDSTGNNWTNYALKFKNGEVASYIYDGSRQTYMRMDCAAPDSMTTNFSGQRKK
jgi:hypothetical protein